MCLIEINFRFQKLVANLKILRHSRLSERHTRNDRISIPFASIDAHRTASFHMYLLSRILGHSKHTLDMAQSAEKWNGKKCDYGRLTEGNQQTNKNWYPFYSKSAKIRRFFFDVCSEKERIHINSDDLPSIHFFALISSGMCFGLPCRLLRAWELSMLLAYI